MFVVGCPWRETSSLSRQRRMKLTTDSVGDVDQLCVSLFIYARNTKGRRTDGRTKSSDSSKCPYSHWNQRVTVEFPSRTVATSLRYHELIEDILLSVSSLFRDLLLGISTYIEFVEGNDVSTSMNKTCSDFYHLRSFISAFQPPVQRFLGTETRQVTEGQDDETGTQPQRKRGGRQRSDDDRYVSFVLLSACSSSFIGNGRTDGPNFEREDRK